MRVGVVNILRKTGSKSILWLEMAALVIAGIAPAFLNTPAEAAQLTSRKVTISTSEADQTGVSYAYSFVNPSVTSVRGIIFQYCTNPVGTCTLPTGMAADHTTASTNATQGFEQDAFTEYTGVDSGACTDHDNGTASTMYCVERADADPESADTETITLDSITNPSLSANFTTVYVRITLYSAASFATPVHSGTVAAAIVRQLTVTGRVTERLQFCVAAALRAAATPGSCSAFPSETEVGIGVIDNAAVYVSPVPNTATNLANDRYGVAMINTNASSGVVLQYFPESATSVSGGDTDQLRRFRVVPTDCSSTPTSVTDQCFISASTSGEAFVANTERFGMQIACVDTASGTTSNLGSVPAAYSNTDNTTTHSAGCEDTSTGDTGVKFAFDDTGGAVTIASSSTVVDDEMVKIRFGAAAAATTPEGSYLVIITYIATPTF